MEDLIFTYLLEKGGIFGVLFAISLLWIIYREKMLFDRDSKSKQESVEIERVLYENIRLELNDIGHKIDEIEEHIKDLWSWHNITDSEGVPIWYVRSSLENAINRLDSSIEDIGLQFNEGFANIKNTITSREASVDKLQRINEDRISELKEFISNYNSTMNNLSEALVEIKRVLKVNID